MATLSWTLLLFLFLRVLWRREVSARQFIKRCFAATKPCPKPKSGLYKPKPQWVIDQVLRLRVLMPGNGCRKIAETFNALFEHRDMTVSKSWVADALKRDAYRLADIRRGIRRRRPRKTPKNLIWGLDLTFVQQQGKQRTILGLIDHGTRACLALRHLRTKASIQILRAVLDAVEQFGKPKAIRTDNEVVFTSKLFRFGLWMLGIRHQRTAPHAPWQNGRIERFFGTFKERLRQLDQGPVRLQENLNLFRVWYNHVRFHDNLEGRTPAQAWSGAEPKPRKQPWYFREWDGVLTGFYFHD